MKRKKSGASLIVVVIIFMFIFTVSTAMLSMVATNYKARIAESKRVENLYASDSGLDVAYNIIGKTFDAATKYGYYEIVLLKSGENNGPNNEKYADIEDDINSLNEYLNTLKHKTPTDAEPQSKINKEIVKIKNLIEEDENMKELLLNEEFKRAFKNFILETDTSQLGSETAPNKLINSIRSHQYVNEVTLGNDNTISFQEQHIDIGITNKDGNSPNLDPVVSEGPANVSRTTEEITNTSDSGHYKNVSFDVYGEQYYDISVSSSFYTERIAGNDTNKRQLQATYKMLVPNYKDIYFANSNGELNKYLATKDRALTIYGDMNVNSVNGLTVNGEIFVRGSNDHISEDRVYGKYFGGITVANSSSVLFKNNVITRGTFNIQNTASDEKTTEIGGNLYARNIYVGKVVKDDGGLASGPSLLDISKGETIVNNDLALNANNATIKIKDFYGINDENNSNKAQSSSSIIVNGNNNSAIYINKSAYMMGTAHIATENDYQTAESGAVKGNYIAYSIPLYDTDKFAYYNPLQLLDADQAAKESHFIKYWSENGNNANAGGIHWPADKDGNIDSSNIWSVGAIVYETDEEIQINGENKRKCIIIPSHYKSELEDSGDIYIKREDFAKYVYKFGKTANINDYYNTNATRFDELIDTSKIPQDYVLTDQQNKGEYAIFNNDSGKEVKIITGSESKIDTTSDSNIIKIEVGKDSDDKYTLNAVIATAGKVSIESDDIILNGCIIAEGDLNVTGNGVKINYKPEVIERIQSQNIDTFNAVFGESILMDTNNTGDDGTSDTNGANANYNLKNFLENKVWKIIK